MVSPTNQFPVISTDPEKGSSVHSEALGEERSKLERLWKDVLWMGVVTATTTAAFSINVFSVIANTPEDEQKDKLNKPYTLASLGATVVAFAVWGYKGYQLHRQISKLEEMNRLSS